MQDDAEQLLAFELDNRRYFEGSVASRGDAYYTVEAVRQVIADAERASRDDLYHQFLIKAEGSIVGRVNLTAVTRPHFNKASLGYRIGERFAGQGHATYAVELILLEAFGKLNLWRLEATARADNPGSIRVLERNGFTVYGRSENCMWLDGVWRDLFYFERRGVPQPYLVAAQN
jgi:ribosomal-protein-alanine N-acetyltransferase